MNEEETEEARHVSGQARHLACRATCFHHGGNRRSGDLRRTERRSNRLAHLLRASGLRRLDHYAIFMENNARYIECCAAGIRSGLYFTCVNSYLTAEELAYIVDNSQSKILISSMARREVALAALAKCPRVELCLLIDGPGDGSAYLQSGRGDVATFPDIPIADEFLGTAMLYSSGTTGRPKGVLRPLPELPPWGELPLFEFLTKQWRYREGMVYLSPAPLYHAAPQAAVSLAIRNGWNGRDHGAVRSRALPQIGREVPRHAQPARTDDVLAHVETAGGGAATLRPLLPRVRCARSCALPDPRQGADDPLVGSHHRRVLRSYGGSRFRRL